MKRSLILSGLAMILTQASFAATYECQVIKRAYKGSSIISSDLYMEDVLCGFAVLDTGAVGKSSAYFRCGRGVLLSIHKTDASWTLPNRTNTTAKNGTYIQLSVLEKGDHDQWATRRPLHTAVLEAKEGIPSDMVLLLSLDRSNVVREQHVGYYAVCKQID